MKTVKNINDQELFNISLEGSHWVLTPIPNNDVHMDQFLNGT